MINKEYFFCITPRQIGIENTLDELLQAKKELLPENAQKEWELFPNKKELLPFLDKIVSKREFENSVQRELKELTNEEMSLACVIYTALNVAEAIKIITYNILTLQEYAQLINKNTEIIRQKIMRGNLPGAIKLSSRQWMIPANAIYENYKERHIKTIKTVLRQKAEENSKTNNAEYYITRTPRQIGHECTEKQLLKDLKANCQPRLQKRHLVFSSLNVALRKLDIVQRPENFEVLIKEKKLLNITPQELAIASAIHTALCIRQAIDFLFYNMMPISEYAKNNRKKINTIKQRCYYGRIEGAMKIGNAWYIPQNTKYRNIYKPKKTKLKKITPGA